MTSIPSNEAERLAALQRLDILDTVAEPEFDELVSLAAAICETPISLVTFVDSERQWFKAATGLAVRETPRDVAFCAHAILQPEMLIVEDAADDARFKDNPLVTGEPNIRFYAGMPIASPTGLAMGTLCVIDRKPRTLTADQRRALEVLARQVNVRIELRVQRRFLLQAVREAEEARAELQKANLALQQLASTDALTGLANRRTFDERIYAEMTGAHRGRCPALLMLDLDNFKSRNDRFGHLAGDDLLQQIATILKRNVRATELAARYGGEEFAVLFPNSTEDDAMNLAERLLKAVRAAEWPHAPATISIGVAEGNASMTGEDLIAAADKALYAAKREGRDTAVRHSRLA